MIQGAINQLLTMGAAAKKASDITKEKETESAARMAEKQAKAAEQQARAIAKEQAAKEKAMERMKQKVQAKWDQNKEYQAFKASLGNNQAPEILKRIAFEAYKNAPEVRVGKDKIDISALGPEAQDAIRRAK